MPTVDIPTEPKVEHLLNSVKQLSPVELDEFRQKFAEWQQKKDVFLDEELDADASDDEVVTYIRKNLKLPDQENRRYWQLRRKSVAESLTDDELLEYQELVQQLTILNTRRLEGVAILVHRWKMPAEEIITRVNTLPILTNRLS